MIVCQTSPDSILFKSGGTTYGSLFGSPDNLEVTLADKELLRHESQHAYQWAANPYGMAEMYPLEFRRAAAQYTEYEENGGSALISEGQCFNRFEIDANLVDGHYKCVAQ